MQITYKPGRRRASLIALLCGTALLAGCRNADVATELSAARAEIDKGQWGEAYVRLKNVAQSEPNNAAARVLLAKIAMAEGNFANAETEIAKVSWAQLPDPADQMVKMRVEISAGRGAEALAALSDPAVKLDASQRKFVEAVVMRGSGSLEKSLELLNDISKQEPNNFDYVGEQVDALVAAGRIDEATAAADEFLSRNPQNTDMRLARSIIDMRAGRPSIAVASMDQLLTAAPPSWPPAKRANALYLLGDTALKLGDVKKAEATLGQLNKLNSGLLAARLLKANIALRQGKAQEAANDLQEISRALPNDPYVQQLLADALLRTRNREQAQSVLERLLGNAPQSLEARRLLAQLYLTQFRPDKVTELVESAPANHQADSALQQYAASAKSLQARATQTADSLRAAIAKNPQDHRSRLELAGALVSGGQAFEALKIVDAVPLDYDPPARLRVRLLALIAQSNRRELDKEVDALLAAKPPKVNLLLLTADLTAAVGRSDLALRTLDLAGKAEPNNNSVNLARAAVLFLDRKYPEADAELKIVLQRDARNVPARLAQARIAAESNDFDKARAALNAALEIDPNAIEVRLTLSGLELRNNRVAEADKILDRLVTQAPANGLAATRAGDLMLTARQSAGAVKFYELAVQQRPTAVGWLQLSRAFLASSRAKDAQAALAQAAKLEPANADVAVALADLESKQGESDAALARLDKLGAAGRNRMDAVIVRGDAQFAKGKYTEALQEYLRAYRSAPTAALAVRLFRAQLQNKGPNPEAALKDWLVRSPRDLPVRQVLAEYYLQKSDNKAAVATYEELAQADPNNPAVLNNLAWLLSDIDGAKAEQMARKAYQLAPGRAAIADTLATVLVKRAKVTEALPLFALASEQMANDGGVLYRYADALAKSGDKVRAKEMAQKSLALSGAFPERAAAESLVATLK